METLKQFRESFKELKQACYDYCNKWYEYQNSFGIDFAVYVVDDFRHKKLSDLEFTYDDKTDIFQIGYKEVDNESDYVHYYSCIEGKELLDESYIKYEIDVLVEEMQRKISKNLQKDSQYQEYLRLKEIYEK